MDIAHRPAHQFGQFVADDLRHHLSGLDRRQYILSQRLGFHFVGERLSHFIVDVGVDQRAPDLFQALGDVDFGDASLSFQDLKRPFEFIGKIFKHISKIFSDSAQVGNGLPPPAYKNTI